MHKNIYVRIILGRGQKGTTRKRIKYRIKSNSMGGSPIYPHKHIQNIYKPYYKPQLHLIETTYRIIFTHLIHVNP